MSAMGDLKGLLVILLLIFVVWSFTGGPDRAENKFNPYITPIESPLDDSEVYGAYPQELAETLQEGQWQPLYKEDFTVLLPQGWVDNTYDGEDGIGKFEGDDIELNYVYGDFANPLSFDGDFRYIVTYENINGEDARLVRPAQDEELITGGHVAKNGNRKITIFGTDLTPEQQEIVFNIIRTVRLN